MILLVENFFTNKKNILQYNIHNTLAQNKLGLNNKLMCFSKPKAILNKNHENKKRKKWNFDEIVGRRR